MLNIKAHNTFLVFILFLLIFISTKKKNTTILHEYPLFYHKGFKKIHYLQYMLQMETGKICMNLLRWFRKNRNLFYFKIN